MENNLLFIVNPKAGKGNISKKIPKIISNFSSQGYIVDTIYTKRNYLPDAIISNYTKKLNLIVCCGGDGTLNEIINSIMKLGKKPLLSFIPLGTMNDFAKTVNLSTNKFYLSKNLAHAKKVKSDIGDFNGKYFNYVAAFGAFTTVPYITTQKLKKRYGKLAYFIVARKCLKKIKSYKLKIKIDNQIIEDEFIYGSISNSKSIAGFKWFKNSDFRIDDGKFELLFIKKPKNISDWFGTIWALLLKQHSKKYFYYKQISNVKIYSNKNITWTLDGEYGGRKKDISIFNINKAIEYIIP